MWRGRSAHQEAVGHEHGPLIAKGPVLGNVLSGEHERVRGGENLRTKRQLGRACTAGCQRTSSGWRAERVRGGVDLHTKAYLCAT